jgi:subtilisin-like proprotein convertase family protein
MGRSAVSLVALVLAMAARNSAADELIGTLGQPVQEVSHTVELRIRDGVATYRVRRVIANGGNRHEEASLAIDLPYGAAVTGLRIRGRDRWHAGELMEADQARALYRKLTGLGPHEPRDPALLQWVWADRVHLQVFPVEPGRTATVEYTLTGPTQYSAGRYVVFYPQRQGVMNLAVPVLRVLPEDRQRSSGLDARLDGRIIAAQEPVVMAAAGPEPELSELESSGSHVMSAVEVDRNRPVHAVRVRGVIRHTYRSDLRVLLQDPGGHRFTVYDQEGGDENDVVFDKRFALPGSGNAAGQWKLIVSDLEPFDVGVLERWSLQLESGDGAWEVEASNLPRAIPDAPDDGPATSGHAIAIAAPSFSGEALRARLGRVDLVAGKHFLRLELDVAPRLRSVPRQLAVVFVLDLSLSMSEERVDAQIEVMRAYLRNAPHARVQVIAFHRQARALTDRFVPARELGAVIARVRAAGGLQRGNGSALDAGLGLAARRLRGVSGTRRIVAMSDTLLRPSWNQSLGRAALAALPRPAVVHIVVPGRTGAPDLERMDDHELAAVVRPTGGLVFALEGANPERRRQLTRTALGLVRPVQIDYVALSPNALNVALDLPSILKEGQGVRELIQLKSAPVELVLRGQIWAESFRQVIRPNPAFARTAAAFVFSHDVYDDLSDEEQLRIAMFGRAVSPVTAYLAIEPGVRPSTAGIEREVEGTGGYGGGRGSGRGRGGGGVRQQPTLDWRRLFAAAVRRCENQFGAQGSWSAQLRIDTTYREIVDVALTSAADKMGTCLAEEAWTVQLPEFDAAERDRFTVVLP